MKVIYYYYYLFYTKIIKDDEPFATTVWSLSLCEGYALSVSLNILLIKMLCFRMDKWMMILPICIILLFNYFYYNKSGRAKKIIQEKPMFFSNHQLSIIGTLIFFVITLSFMFWGAFYTKHLLETGCR